MTKVAVLGFGFMGRKHFDILKKNPDFTVAAIIDNHKISNPETETFQSLDCFLKVAPAIDIVIIATPNFDHFISAKRLMEAGYSVFLEKPYCFTADEAHQLQLIAKKNYVKIFFSNQNRHSPVSKFVKSLIQENLLGEIYLVQTNLFWSRNHQYYQPGSWKGTKSKDRGTLYTQFFHFLDLIIWIFGDIEVKTAYAKTLKHQNYIEIEDTGSFTYELLKGGIGVLTFTTTVLEKNLESSMTIIGENGSVKISGQYFDEVEFCDVENFEFRNELIEKTDNISNLAQNHKAVQMPYDEHLAAQNFKTVKIIEDIYKKIDL